MNVEHFNHLNWLEPWEPTTHDFEAELHRELIAGHPLFGVRAIAVGRRCDCDDVLFLLSEHSSPLAVVHLTWQRETTPDWPHTELYASLADWIERCMKPDSLEYSEGNPAN